MKKLIISFFAFTTLLHAGPEVWLQQGLVTPEIIESLKYDLGLTAEQEAKMQSIVSAARAEGEPLEQSVKEQQKAFHELLKKRDANAEAASAALSKLLEAEAPVKQLQLRALLELRDVMTPEQQKKALKLAPGRTAKTEGLETSVRQKADKLRAAVESLDIKPTRAMSERGTEIERMIRAGEWSTADAALDKLNQESGANLPETAEPLDFAKFDAGNTDLEVLKERYQAVLQKGESVISIPLMRQFLNAKEAMEEAKSAQDADKVGRILTWAEQELEKL